MLKRILYSVTLGLLAASWPALAAESPFSSLSGEPRPVAAYTGGGQWTVVMIWASDCAVCRGEAPELESFHQRHKGSDARVVGLSVDGPDGVGDARDFIADTGISFPNLIGSGEDTAALFYDETGNHLLGTPAFLVFNPAGRLRTYQTGRLNLQLLERLMESQKPLTVAEGS